jgi:hypothetical protein
MPPYRIEWLDETKADIRALGADRGEMRLLSPRSRGALPLEPKHACSFATDKARLRPIEASGYVLYPGPSLTALMLNVAVATAGHYNRQEVHPELPKR